MVEVFATKIENRQMASGILTALQLQFPGMEVNIDLDDCDRVMRCESDHIDSDAIIAFVKSFKNMIAVLI